MDPMTLSALISTGGSLLGGLFGSDGGEMSPEAQRIYRFMMRSAREARQFGNGVPGSDPQEMAALGQNMGAYNRMWANQNAGLLAGNPDLANGQADRVGNLASAKVAGGMAINNAHLLQSLAARQNAKFNTAPSLAQGALGAANSPRSQGFDLAGPLASLSSAFAYSQARKAPTPKPWDNLPDAAPFMSAPGNYDDFASDRRSA